MAARLVYWLPAIGIMGIIAYFSHQSQWPPGAEGFPDWLLHGTAYGVLASAVWVGFAGRFRPCRRALSQLPMTVVVASLYGVFDEWHQSFVPGRDAALGDWMADTIGAVVAVLLLLGLTIADPWGVCED